MGGKPPRDLRAEWQADTTRFGLLEPLYSLGWKNGRTYWLFRCQCGNEHEAAVGNVSSGDVSSCGCVRRASASRLVQAIAGSNRSANFESAKRWLFGSYQTRAASKGRAFTISFEQFCFLIEQPCYICHAEKSNAFKRTGCNYVFHYNGIDRIDNSKGYEDGNVAPCCKDCNYAKGTKSLNEFYLQLERVQLRRRR